MILRKTKPEEAWQVNERFAIAFEQPAESGTGDQESEGSAIGLPLKTTVKP